MAHQIQLWIFWDEVCTDLCREIPHVRQANRILIACTGCSHVAKAHLTRNANALANATKIVSCHCGRLRLDYVKKVTRMLRENEFVSENPKEKKRIICQP